MLWMKIRCPSCTLQKRCLQVSVQLNRYHTGYSWQHLRGTTKNVNSRRPWKTKLSPLTQAANSVDFNVFKQSSAALRDDIHEPGFCFWKFVVRGAPFKKRCFQIVVQETVSPTWSHTIQNYASLSSNACLLGDLENGNLVVQENQYLFHILHQLKVVV